MEKLEHFQASEAVDSGIDRRSVEQQVRDDVRALLAYNGGEAELWKLVDIVFLDGESVEDAVVRTYLCENHKRRRNKIREKIQNTIRTLRNS